MNEENTLESQEIEATQAENSDEAPTETLVEEISIDGMCGVY